MRLWTIFGRACRTPDGRQSWQARVEGADLDTSATTGDMVPAPRQFAERFFRIVRWTELRAGGHFTAWEEPEAFARELTALARDVVPETSYG